MRNLINKNNSFNNNKTCRKFKLFLMKIVFHLINLNNNNDQFKFFYIK